MSIYNFDIRSEKFRTIDKIKDVRSDYEKENPLLSVFNHDKAGIALAEAQAQELIHISGAPIIVYRYLPMKHAEGTIESLWEEENTRIFDSGQWIKGTFKADPLNLALTKFGVDMPLKINVNFSRAELLKLMGERLIRVDDVLRVPYNLVGKELPNYFQVVNSYESGNFQYRWLYWTCQCTLLYNDETIRPFIEYEKNIGWL